MHRKAPADAGALAVAERLPCVDGTPGFGFAAEIVRVESVGIGSPHAGITVQRGHQDGDEGALPELVFAAANALVLERRDPVGGGRWPQPQGPPSGLPDIATLRHLPI